MSNVEYRILGKTGVKVSEIGFGCGNVGGLMIRGSYQEQLEAVNLALKLGINYFDTAPSYGDGQSEINLGRVLEELNPKVTVATKIRISVEDIKNIVNVVEKSIRDSLKRLKMDSIDVLQLHSRISSERDSQNWSGSVSLNEVLGEDGIADALDSVRDAGLTRFIGFTGLGETQALHNIIESGRFDVVQSYYNILNPSSGWNVPKGFKGYDFSRLIDKAVSFEVGVAAIRVMAAGALGGLEARKGYAAPVVRGPMVPGAEYYEDVNRGRRLNFLVSGDVKSIPEAAIRFVLMHSGVSVVLVGFSNLSQIEEAAACSGKGPLSLSSLEQLGKIWSSCGC